MKSKKVPALVLALLLPFTFTSCSAEENEYEFLPEELTIYKDFEPVSLTFYFPGQMPKTWPEVKEEIEKQTSSTLNMKLDFKWLNTAYCQTINELSASDDIFDAFVCSQPRQGYPNFTKLARDGQIKDISELFPKSAPELYQKFSQEELDYAKVDGKLYAVPSLYPQVYGAYIRVNAELTKKYGLEDIKTLDDYEKYLEAVKNDNAKLTPGTIYDDVDTLNLFSRGSGYVIADRDQKLVYKWDDPEMKIIPWEKTPEFKTSVSYIMSWYKKGYLTANPIFEKTTSFVDYGILTPPNSDTTILTCMTKTGDILESEPLRTFHLFPDNKAQRDNPMGNYFVNGSYLFCSKSENTERALMFLEWAHKSGINNRLMKYGIENKDYVLADGYPSLPENSDVGNYIFHGRWTFNNMREGMIKDMTEVEAFIAKLEERGSESMANLLQNQLDEYNSRKGE